MKSELVSTAFFLVGCIVLAFKLDFLTYMAIGLLFTSQAITIDNLRNALRDKLLSKI